jgi:hypothetical protein
MSSKPLACWICGKEINLNNCKTDERGLPVHGLCYVARIAAKSNQQPPLREQQKSGTSP